MTTRLEGTYNKKFNCVTWIEKNIGKEIIHSTLIDELSSSDFLENNGRVTFLLSENKLRALYVKRVPFLEEFNHKFKKYFLTHV